MNTHTFSWVLRNCYSTLVLLAAILSLTALTDWSHTGFQKKYNFEPDTPTLKPVISNKSNCSLSKRKEQIC